MWSIGGLSGESAIQPDCRLASLATGDRRNANLMRGSTMGRGAKSKQIEHGNHRLGIGGQGVDALLLRTWQDYRT
jgi:hypothetical protein